MAEVTVTETDGGWTFRFADGRITQLRVDHGLSLVLAGGALIVLEAAFTLTRPDGTSELVPPGDVVHEVGAALPLFDRVVSEAHAPREGGLRVELVDGHVLLVAEAHPQWETWQLVAPDGEQWVGAPGGGVTWYPPGQTTGVMRPGS
ncbi:MAG TPA: DUF6188 family protein [Iamia sp.]